MLIDQKIEAVVGQVRDMYQELFDQVKQLSVKVEHGFAGLDKNTQAKKMKTLEQKINEISESFHYLKGNVFDKIRFEIEGIHDNLAGINQKLFHKDNITHIINKTIHSLDDHPLFNQKVLRKIQIQSKYLKQFKCISKIKCHNDWIFHLAFLDNFSNIATCSADKSLKIININSKQVITDLKGHTDTITCLLYLRNNVLLSAGYDRTIIMWDLTTNESVKYFQGHTRQIRCLEKIDNDTFLSGSSDNTIRVWDANKLCLAQTIDDYKDVILTIKFTKEQYIISGSANGVIKVKDYKNLETK